MKCVRIKQRTDDWIDSDVLQCIKDCDAAFYTYKRNETEDNLLAFRESRNKAQSYIFKAKKSYFISIFSNCSNSKSLWSSLKQLGLPSKKG